MTHMLYKPKNFMSPLMGEMLLNDFFRSGNESSGSILPAVNIQEKEDGWKLELAIPGIPKEKVKIQVENQLLTITAEQVESKDEVKYQRKEFGYPGFSRSFTLPESINLEGIEAKQEDGILGIFIPKKLPVKNEKVITIQ
jgi:HSP20 family protein